MDGENNEVSIDINKVGGSPLPSIAAVNTTTVTRPECHREMYKAARKGDWKAAEVLLRKDRNLACAKITANGDGALHVAAANKHTEFVLELVKVISELEDLPREEWFDLLIATIRSSMYDVALDILNMNESLAKMRNQEGTALHHLAQPVFAYNITGKKKLLDYLDPARGRRLEPESQDRGVRLLAEKLWAEIQKLGQDDVAELIEKPFSILHEAAKAGNVELIDMIARSIPHLLFRVDENKHTIFHTAVLYRQQRVFNLIHQIGDLKEMIATSVEVDKDGNNILHLAGILAPPSRLNVVSGAAFQMESEVLWFTEVNEVVPHWYHKMKNKDGLIPREVFSKEHQLLLEKGEKWMKQTSNSGMLIATIIATVAFSAAITLPGGNNNDTGMPLLLKSKWFTVFLVSDVVAMLCATISMLTFLFIVTSPYSEGHFIARLPQSLMVAMVTLEYAVIAMLVAFTSAFYLVSHKEKAWIPKCVFAFTCLTSIYTISKLSLSAYSSVERMFQRILSPLREDTFTAPV